MDGAVLALLPPQEVHGTGENSPVLSHHLLHLCSVGCSAELLQVLVTTRKEMTQFLLVDHHGKLSAAQLLSRALVIL